MAASTAIGMRPAQRPKKRVMSSRVSACTIPAMGVRPPFFTLVAVRAMAPVAGMPPNKGETTLATPCATSSMLERCRDPIIPSATTAERSDSIPASSDGESGSDQSARHPPRNGRKAGPRQGRVNLPKPIADRFHREMEYPHQCRHCDQGNERSWNAMTDSRPESNDRERRQRHARRGPVHRCRLSGVSVPLTEEIRWNGPHLKPQQVLHLAGEDDKGNAGGKSQWDGEGDELDCPSEPGESHDDQDYASHQGCDPEAFEPVLLDDTVDNHHEGAGRSPDLHPRAAQCGNEESRDDRGVQAPLGRDSAGDGEGDGQW